MSWHAKATGAYSYTSTEGLENAQMIYNILNARGWSLNAICAVIGNIYGESGLNPWRWNSDNVQAKGSTQSIAYGLVQFYPYTKYADNTNAQAITGFGVNYSDQVGSTSDGNAQIIFVDEYGDYISSSSYSLSYSDFKTSSESIDYLVNAWYYNYERAGGSPNETRFTVANYFYNLWSETPPEPSPEPEPEPTEKKKSFWWIYYMRNPNRIMWC